MVHNVNYHTQSGDWGTGNLPKSLNILAKGEQPICYHKLMLGCDENMLGRILSPSE